MWSNSCFIRGIRPRDRKTFATVVFLGIVIAGFLLAYTAFSGGTSSSTLSLVIIVFRHGEKIPSSYPKDPYKSMNWPQDQGELTNNGKVQLYELGRILRNRYKDFLDDQYSDSELHVESSYAARCQMSAQALLAGLYPPVGRQIWNPDLLWQPIPTNPIPRKYDNMIAAKADCPAFDVEKLRSDKEMSSKMTRLDQELFGYLTEHSGEVVNNISGVEALFSILSTQKEMGLMIPNWSESVFPEPMKHLAALNLASFSWTPNLARFKSGPMLANWERLISLRLNGSRPQVPKLNLYSGHDLTLVTTLRGLGINTLLMPQYGAALALELHSVPEHNFINVFYFNSSKDDNPTSLTIPGCDVHCSLDTFFQIIAPIIPEDWKEECKIQQKG